MTTLDTLYKNREMEKTREDYLRGYMHALADLEGIIDDSEHLGDSNLLETLCDAIFGREVIRN